MGLSGCFRDLRVSSVTKPPAGDTGTVLNAKIKPHSLRAFPYQTVQQAGLSLCIPLNLTLWNLQTPCREKLSQSLWQTPWESSWCSWCNPIGPPNRSLPPTPTPRTAAALGVRASAVDSAAESDCHTLWWEDRLSQQASPSDSCRGRTQFRALLFLAGGLRYVTRWIC